MAAAIAAAMGEEANVAFVVLSFLDAGAFERCDDEGLVGDEAKSMLSSLFFIGVMDEGLVGDEAKSMLSSLFFIGVMVIVLRGLFGSKMEIDYVSCLDNCES